MFRTFWLLCLLTFAGIALGIFIIPGCIPRDTITPLNSLGENPSIVLHASNVDISNGKIPLEELVLIGNQIFDTSFNTLDGAGNSKTRSFTTQSEVMKIHSTFNRISGPDANSCAGCHNMPISGGGGDNVANVFVLAHSFPNLNFDQGSGDLFEELSLTTAGNERGTISMFGSGLIELLAREMTSDLHIIRQNAIDSAIKLHKPVTVDIKTKNVDFGQITVWPDGLIDTSNIEGIDSDLIVKPFGQKGVYTSLREFTLDAFEIHHGLQPEERVGTDVDGDLDGITNELTIGDITAVTLFQASLPPPVVDYWIDEYRDSYVESGANIFAEIGCTVCHKPFLELNNPIFAEPNPYSPSGTLIQTDMPDIYLIDLYKNAIAKDNVSGITKTDDGTYLVRAFTDLKRHDMGDLLANETIEQRFVDRRFWLTRKLWGFISEPPFMHHGRATLIQEAINLHRGEADFARVNYLNLTKEKQNALIEFLKSLD